MKGFEQLLVLILGHRIGDLTIALDESIPNWKLTRDGRGQNWCRKGTISEGCYFSMGKTSRWLMRGMIGGRAVIRGR